MCLGLFVLEGPGENSRCRTVTSKGALSARPAASRPGPAPPRAQPKNGSLHHPPRQSTGGPGLRAQLQHRRRSGRDSRVKGGWKERQTGTSNGEARPGRHRTAKGCLPATAKRTDWASRATTGPPDPAPGAGMEETALDSSLLNRAAPLRPSPSLGSSRGADLAARSGPPAPRTHRRRPPSSPRPPPLGSRSLPPPGHAARWPRALPPPGPGLLLSKSGQAHSLDRTVPGTERPTLRPHSADPVQLRPAFLLRTRHH